MGGWAALQLAIRHPEVVHKLPDEIQAIAVPTLLIIGDADVVRPAHAAEMFELLDGCVPGDWVGPPPSQLAVLPGTTHLTLLERTDWLVSMITAFLDAPMPKTA